MRDPLQSVLPYLKADIVGRPDDRTSLELSAADAPVLKPFVGQLLISYVVDQGDALAFVSGRDLETYDLTVDELHARALVNVESLANERGMKVHAMSNLVAVTFEGNFEATLMLVPSLWAHLTSEYGGGLVVGVPARDVLAVARGGHEIAELRRVIDRIWPDGDHLLTRELYAWDGAGWRLHPSE